MSSFTVNSLLDRFLRMAPSDKKVECIEALHTIVDVSRKDLKSGPDRVKIKEKIFKIKTKPDFVKLKNDVEEHKSKAAAAKAAKKKK